MIVLYQINVYIGRTFFRGMQEYQDLLRNVVIEGEVKSDRTGVGTLSTFGNQMRFDLEKGFPLLTTKKIHTKSIIYELLWFLKGNTNIQYLNENGVTMWDEWADAKGDLGRVYGAQWIDWRTPDGKSVNQIYNLVEGLKKNPDSRRHIVNAWNVGELEQMALTPCHCMFQCNVAGGKLDLQLYQRSADLFLGVPFNIASYAMLTHMLAQVAGLKPGKFVHTFGDVHLYNGKRGEWYKQNKGEIAKRVGDIHPIDGRWEYNEVASWIVENAPGVDDRSDHVPLALEQMARDTKALPSFGMNPLVKDIFGFSYADFSIIGYDPHPTIKAKIAV